MYNDNSSFEVWLAFSDYVKQHIISTNRIFILMFFEELSLDYFLLGL